MFYSQVSAIDCWPTIFTGFRLSVNYYVGALLYDRQPEDNRRLHLTACCSEYHAYGASAQVDGGVPVMGVFSL